MKRMVPYLLLALFLYNSVGYYPIFLFLQNKQKQEIKHIIKNTIPTQELTAFTFDASEYAKLIWMDQEEFLYNGNMYDLVRMQIDSNGRIIIHVINDNKENKLLASLEKQQQKESSAASENTAKLFELFTFIYLPMADLLASVQQEKELKPFLPASSLFTILIKVPSPPPKDLNDFYFSI